MLCYRELNPNNNTGRFKMKENYFDDEIFSKLDQAPIRDKRITGGTSKYRPDWLQTYDTHNVIWEHDENQHDQEEERLNALYLDSGKPIIVVRFNPDKYINDQNQTICGCFEFDKENNLIVNEEEFERRKNIILDIFSKTLFKPDKDVHIIKLFFDGYA